MSTMTLWDDNDPNTIEKHHTHLLLLDDGRLGRYLDDRPRATFVKKACEIEKCHAVTIIVEGGGNTLEVIYHDLQAKRSIVIVHGSGRLANVLGNLLKNAGKTKPIEYVYVHIIKKKVFILCNVRRDEIIKELKLCKRLWPEGESEPTNIVQSIEKILDVKYRRYLSIFELGQDVDLTNTIFQTVFDSKNIRILFSSR